jgi:hypothetical protein
MFYTATERLVYESPTKAKYDPVALHRKLVLAAGGKLNDWLATWGDEAAAEVDVAKAEEGLVAAARAALALTPFGDGTGHTDRDAIDALCHFLEWCEGKDLRGR